MLISTAITAAPATHAGSGMTDRNKSLAVIPYDKVDAMVREQETASSVIGIVIKILMDIVYEIEEGRVITVRININNNFSLIIMLRKYISRNPFTQKVVKEFPFSTPT